ncbi:LAETG motif-containing sortase-dependent surface protein [Streptantibioticus ferralitis]|uniref:LAETG motif-containing sortase-dependent surface protein n=1 Tax=Streptantibioticus ferralitis TaxID=236510 RepID=A0ABT5YWD3_9ACTN|nr:LAETG motif-containing sortase-dependent surface protein [Streptantibioticus ferralitis]MDF2255759.1 LAETG motif-containing sortase-dependent surface protein [Streptantibioticus ferralitis]
MTRASRGRRRTGVIAAAAFTALLGTGILAAPASAHVPGWSVTCDKVSIDLTYYNAHATNTVTVKADGKDLLPTTTFPDAFSKTLELPAHSSPLQVELVVHAGDDQRYSSDQTKTAPVCASTSPAPSPTPSSTPSSSSTPVPGVSATISASAVAPVPSPSKSGPNLAETGGSSSTPVIAGVAVAVLTAGGGLFLMGRRRRTYGSHASR